MATQEIPRDLGVPWHGAVYVYCSRCAVEHPLEKLRRIGFAGGQRFEMATLDYLSEYVDDPGALSSLEYVDPEPQVSDDPAGWWTRSKLRKLRTGVLFEVRKNANRINYEEFAADVASRQFLRNLTNAEQLVSEALGFQRSTVSRHHLSLVKLEDNESSSLLTCWKCGIRARVGRERLSRAVDHIKEFGGLILVAPTGIEIRESMEPFNWSPRRRSSSRRPSRHPR